MECCNMKGNTLNDAVLVKLQSEVTKLIKDTTAKLLLQDGKINSLCQYIKNNLSNALASYLQEMDARGELDNIITDAVMTTLSSVDTRTQYIINVKEFGAKGDGVTDDTVAIKDALKSVGDMPCLVVFPAGTYALNGSIEVYSNTVIDFNNSVLIGNNAQFINNKLSVDKAGYGQLKNIIIKNGTVKGGAGYLKFALIHADNVRFENMIFDNAGYNQHCIELGGCRNVTVEGCHVKNVRLASDSINPYVECIQIEYAGYNGMPYWAEGSIGYDLLPCKNIRITNCTFEKGEGTHYPNAVGGHGVYDGVHENITVDNCKFYGWTYSSIRAIKWNNVIIRDNYFETADEQASLPAILVESGESTSTTTYVQENVKILGNTFVAMGTSKRRFVYMQGKSNKVVIADNIYKGTYDGVDNSSGSDFVQMDYCDMVMIMNNYIEGAKNVVFTYNERNHCVYKNNVLNKCRTVSNFENMNSELVTEKQVITARMDEYVTEDKLTQLSFTVVKSPSIPITCFEKSLSIKKDCKVLISGNLQIGNPQGEGSLYDLIIYRGRDDVSVQIASTRLRPIANYENSTIAPFIVDLKEGDSIYFYTQCTTPGATLTSNTYVTIEFMES